MLCSKVKALLLLGATLIKHGTEAASTSGTPSLSGSIVPESYSKWLTQKGGNYNHRHFVGSNDEVALHWRIANDTIHLAVAVQAIGWLGFGFSEAGGMKGSDMFLYVAEENRIIDAYATDYTLPFVDSCQDWHFVNAIVNKSENIIVVEVTRSLDTGDKQDIRIHDDSDVGTADNRVIAAWGDRNQYTYHGNKVGLGLVNFFRSATSSSEVDIIEQEASAFHVDLRVPNYTIPTEKTTYKSFCYNSTDLLALGVDMTTKVHLIAAYYLASQNDPMVHHIVIYGGYDDTKCMANYQPVWTWAPGSPIYRTPENVGIPFGRDGYKILRMEMHYDNPHQASGKINSSGSRFIFVNSLRQHDAGPFVVGDPRIALRTTPVGPGWSQWNFDCPRSCTQNYLTENITIFKSFLHMHESGERMVLNQIRDGKVIKNSYVDNYDFSQAGGFDVPGKSFTVSPGDSFQTICYYKSGEDSTRTFGLASDEEMCMVFFWYYPRKASFPGLCGAGLGGMIPGCGGDYNYTKLLSEREIGRTFGQQNKVCITPYDSEKSSATSSFWFGSAFSYLVAPLALAVF